MRRKICAQSREQVEELEKLLKRMQDQLGTYEKDMEAVSSFLLVYDSKKDEQQKLLRENQKKELHFWKNRRQSEGRCRN